MKKIISIMLLLALLVAGCAGGAAGNNNDNNNGDKNYNGNGKVDGYVFETGGAVIAMNAEVAPIVEKLGEPLEYFEAESCAFQGMEKIYTYSGFEIKTYEIDGVDCVLSVTLLDDSVKTKEGIYLSSSLTDVLEAYGDDYTEGFGLYTYTKGNSELSFLVENDEVVSIEYKARTEE
ncbi:MAG TPA: hypothetical protein PK830_09300 [Candidatus Atribacteria bacterium]|nr:hypothetical protein [Candidatus Atribacteria bacterium]HPT79281.1 hypothetical protein [Candidatus Atribacteria bacterium]